MSSEGLEPLAPVWKTDSLPLTYEDKHVPIIQVHVPVHLLCYDLNHIASLALMLVINLKK